MPFDIAGGAGRETREIRHFHLFCGSGGGAKGFNAGAARVGKMEGRFRCLGGIDNDPAAIADFEGFAGVPGTVLDMFDRAQYVAWHGKEPPAGWREVGPDDIRRAAGNERPHILFTSAPCKGFSGLLAESKSAGPRYQALNRLTVRGIMLALEAWRDDPPEFILFENVPRISTRGLHLLGQIEALLTEAGYAVGRTTHDCGELGGLAQTRKRFLLVARHREKVPPFLYEPEKSRLRAVGELLERMPMPDDTGAGLMHTLPQLTWKTWIRLAFVEAGSDWRSLHRLAVEDGHLRDYLVVPEMRRSVLGVAAWDEASFTITGDARPTKGKFAVADPRPRNWNGGKYRIVRYDEAAGAVIGASATGNGAFAVADPRPGFDRSHGNYMTGRHYGVVPWSEPSFAVTAHPKNNNGAWSVADPRLPEPNDRLRCVIRALDGTWHRPFTTLELAVLQSMVEPEEGLVMHGSGHTAWRERIGNLVPPKSATAIANVMGTALLLAWSGSTFALGATPIWVRPVAVAASVDVPDWRAP